jgi:uncharacterized phage protein (TIGR02218 family)
MLTADCFTLWLANGAVLTYTDLDLPVALNGFTYLANSILISGLKYRASCGVNVDSQQVTIFARATDTIGGAPFLQALQQGLFDGAEIQREKVFFASWGTPPVGSVVLFKGRVAQIDSIGRTSAQVTVASDLVLLDIDMPRNCYQANCQHVLYDANCGVVAGTYSTSGNVGAGSTRTQIEWSGAASAHQQGTITLTSGANTGVTATIKSAGSSWLQLAYPLPYAPAAGDVFSASYGCDRTMATCQSRFNNLSQFRGFPFVPPPQIMTGPLSSAVSNSAKGGK